MHIPVKLHTCMNATVTDLNPTNVQPIQKHYGASNLLANLMNYLSHEHQGKIEIILLANWLVSQTSAFTSD